MVKILKITCITLLALILFLAISIVLFLHFADPNQFKDKITSAVYEHTGRTLTINGDLSWSFLPGLGLNVTNIALSNPTDFGSTSFATATKAEINIHLLPLLRGKLLVRNIELNGLQLNLIRNASGANNWSNFSNASPTTNAAPQPSAAPTINNTSTDSAAHHYNFSLAKLIVVNGEINWDDQQNKQQYSLSKLYINGTNIGTQQVFPLTITTTLSSNHFAQPINFKLNGQFNISNDFSTFAINQIEAKINELEIQGDFSLTDLNNAPAFKGDLHLPQMNLPNVLRSLNINLPPMKQADALNQVSTDLAFNGDKNSFSIKPLTINLNDTAITGNIDVKNLAAPELNFKLDVNQLNIDNYLPRTSEGKQADALPPTSNVVVSPASTTNETNADKPINLPTDFLRKFTASGSLNVKQLVVANLHLTNVSATLNAKQGALNIAPVKLNLYEGSADASVGLNVQSSTPSYHLTLDTQKIQAEPFINDLMNKDFVTGTANLSANLTTSGNTINTLVKQLNGSSKFAFNNGVLKGIDVTYELNVAKALLNHQSPPAEPTNKTTPFGETTGTITIHDGVATNNDFLLDSPNVVGKGKGTVDLVQQKIDYQINITSDQAGDFKNYHVPINIKGKLSGPSISLNTDDILQQVLDQQKQNLKKQAKQQVQKEIEKNVKLPINNQQLSDAIGNLFG